MHIRAEQPNDREAIRAVNLQAFDAAAEAALVDELHASCIDYLSLVAAENGAIVGHIVFTPMALPDKTAGITVTGLGPMAVAPAHQRRGIGSQLITGGVALCRERGYDAIVVLGHSWLYPKFGFRPASRYGIACEYEAPDEAFMALELREGALSGVSGTVRYHAAFNGV